MRKTLRCQTLMDLQTLRDAASNYVYMGEPGADIEKTLEIWTGTQEILTQAIALIESEHERLRELARLWRSSSSLLADWTCEDCADELESLLQEFEGLK